MQTLNHGENLVFKDDDERDSQGVVLTVMLDDLNRLVFDTAGEGQEWPHTITLSTTDEETLLAALLERQRNRKGGGQ